MVIFLTIILVTILYKGPSNFVLIDLESGMRFPIPAQDPSFGIEESAKLALVYERFDTRYANFYVDGQQYANIIDEPFSIAGSTDGKPNQWVIPRYNSPIAIAVQTNHGSQESINITFSKEAREEPELDGVEIRGEMKTWSTLEFVFDAGKTYSETSNVYTNTRATMIIQTSNGSEVVRGFFAADGNAAISGATSGSKFMFRYKPANSTRYAFKVYFNESPNIALSTGQDYGTLKHQGSFTVDFNTDNRDGRVVYDNTSYLKYAQSNKIFLKTGVGSPESFLAFDGFDNTPAKHNYNPHANDFPASANKYLWNGKGKNILGAISYLASVGVNSIYMLVMNVDGDGDNVFPWLAKKDYLHFDTSKLDQWERVFEYAESLGFNLHMLFQEQENSKLLNGGDLGTERKLLYLEIVARFGHHLRVIWNTGEEDRNTSTNQRKAQVDFLRLIDSNGHPIVTHTHPGQNSQGDIYIPMLNQQSFSGVSLQTRPNEEWSDVRRWIGDSNGKWIASLDELTPADTGVKSDSADPSHDRDRKGVLWDVFMAGGTGTEHYFGSQQDKNLQDFRSRDTMYKQSKYARLFFEQYLKRDMKIVALANSRVLSNSGCVLVYYNSNATKGNVPFTSAGNWQVKYYNPRTGVYAEPKMIAVSSASTINVGNPPSDTGKDWALVATK